jgi:hypothetical protein
MSLPPPTLSFFEFKPVPFLWKWGFPDFVGGDIFQMYNSYDDLVLPHKKKEVSNRRYWYGTAATVIRYVWPLDAHPPAR